MEPDLSMNINSDIDTALENAAMPWRDICMVDATDVYNIMIFIEFFWVLYAIFRTFVSEKK